MNRKHRNDFEGNNKMCIEKCENAKVLSESINSSILLKQCLQDRDSNPVPPE